MEEFIIKNLNKGKNWTSLLEEKFISNGVKCAIIKYQNNFGNKNIKYKSICENDWRVVFESTRKNDVKEAMIYTIKFAKNLNKLKVNDGFNSVVNQIYINNL